MAATTDTPAGKDTSMKPKQSDALNIVRLNGVNWPWMVTQESLDTLRSYDVWEDDVWVTTYPKAGKKVSYINVFTCLLMFVK